MQVQFAVNLPNMIKNFAKSIPNIISNMWNSVKNFFSSGVSNIFNVAKGGFSNVLSAITQYIKQVPSTVSNFMTQAVNKIKSINLFSIGKSMIQGLINGIKNMASGVVGAIGNVVTSAIDSAKKKLGINSPSRVFRKIGDGTGEGLILGIQGKENDVKKASQNLSASVINGYDAKINTKFSNNNDSTSQGISNNSNSQIVVNTTLDGKIIAQTIASYSDAISGSRMNLAERGLVL